MAFKHEAEILSPKGNIIHETKCCYQNRTWESYKYQSVIRKAINTYFEPKIAKRYMKAIDTKALGKEKKRFDPVKAICALGEIMCDSTDEKAKWKKRMIGTVDGISFPEGFDALPAAEQLRRLDGALGAL
jgi:hypothetical protein